MVDKAQQVTGLIDSHVSTAQAETAVTALSKHIAKASTVSEETEILGPKEEFIWLVVSTKMMPSQQKVKPIRMYVYLFFTTGVFY